VETTSMDALVQMLQQARASNPLPGVPENAPGGGLSALLPQVAGAAVKALPGMTGGGAQPGMSSPARPGVVMPPTQHPAAVMSGPTGVMPTAMPGGGAQGAAPMSEYQAGGPAARTAPPQAQQPNNFPNKQARNASYAASAMQSLAQIVQDTKKKRFETEAADASIITQSQIAKAKQAQGQPLSQQDMQAIEMAGKLEKKSAKIMEKAMTDPMSGAYVGTQRAYQSEQQRQDAELKKQEQLAKIQSDIANKAMLDRYRMGMLGAKEDQITQKGKELEQKELDRRNSLVMRGLKDGYNTTFDEDGAVTNKPFTADEVKADPKLSLLKAVGEARITKMDADARIEAQNAFSKRIQANAAMLHAQKYQPGQAKPSAQMQKFEMLGGMAKDYLEQMQTIVQRRPDLFGPGGWGKSKMEQAAGNGDQDAMQLIKLSHAASLPIAGIHNMRNMHATGEISDDLKSQWQSQQSALDGINNYLSTSEKLTSGEYGKTAPSPAAPSPAAPTPDKPKGKDKDTTPKSNKDPLGLFNN
jgi:hypothetical protein